MQCLMVSLEPDIVFNSSNACVQCDCVLLQDNLLLDQSIGLLLQEINLVDIDIL